MRPIKTLLIIFSFLFFTFEVNASQVPKLIHYQGVIDGVENDELQIEFRFWDSQSTFDNRDIGQLIWGMRYTITLGPGGCFSILLGDETGVSMGGAVNDLRFGFDGSERYLGLKIYSINDVLTGADEIYPRKQIASTPFAMRAVFSNNGVPIGSIIAWHKSFPNTDSQLPYGWVECNGQPLDDAESDYDQQIIPNLNGLQAGELLQGVSEKTQLFLRGGETSGIGQDHQFETHRHLLEIVKGSAPGDSQEKMENATGVAGTGSWWTSYDEVTDISGNHGLETRPSNMSVVWIMKVK